MQIIHSLGEELDRDTPVVPAENGLIEGAGNSQGTQQLRPEVNNSSQLKNDRITARARAVGLDYEFATLLFVMPGHKGPQPHRLITA